MDRRYRWMETTPRAWAMGVFKRMGVGMVLAINTDNKALVHELNEGAVGRRVVSMHRDAIEVGAGSGEWRRFEPAKHVEIVVKFTIDADKLVGLEFHG